MSVPEIVQTSSILDPRPLVDHALACDAVWFGGAGRDGTSLIVSGARRKENILQSMVFVNIPGKDTYGGHLNCFCFYLVQFAINPKALNPS